LQSLIDPFEVGPNLESPAP